MEEKGSSMSHIEASIYDACMLWRDSIELRFQGDSYNCYIYVIVPSFLCSWVSCKMRCNFSIQIVLQNTTLVSPSPYIRPSRPISLFPSCPSARLQSQSA